MVESKQTFYIVIFDYALILFPSHRRQQEQGINDDIAPIFADFGLFLNIYGRYN